MEATNYDMIFEDKHVASKEALVSSADKETLGSFIDHYDEPIYFFKGAFIGLIFSLPFWILIFWLINCLYKLF
jgi:hypothetical protein